MVWLVWWQAGRCAVLPVVGRLQLAVAKGEREPDGSEGVGPNNLYVALIASFKCGKDEYHLYLNAHPDLHPELPVPRARPGIRRSVANRINHGEISEGGTTGGANSRLRPVLLRNKTGGSLHFGLTQIPSICVVASEIIYPVRCF